MCWFDSEEDRGTGRKESLCIAIMVVMYYGSTKEEFIVRVLVYNAFSMSSDNNSDDAYPYRCEITVHLPTAEMAADVQRILSVDREIGDRVVKELQLAEEDAAVHVSFRATEARLLRVSVSSFYEYLIVCLKCYQEFGSST